MNDCSMLKSMSKSIFEPKLVVLALELVQNGGGDSSSHRYKEAGF